MSPGGAREALHALGEDVLAAARVRLELVSVELQEESQRQKDVLRLTAVAVLFGVAGLAALAVLVVAAFWETHRLAALAAVTGAYLAAAAWAGLRLRERVRTSPPPFSGTIAEFQRDLDMLRGPQ